MNYNSGAYDQNLNYSGVSVGNYNSGSYRSFFGYKNVNISSLAERKLDLFVNQGNEFLTTFVLKDSNGNIFDLTGCKLSGSFSEYIGVPSYIPINAFVTDNKSGKIALSLAGSLTKSLTKNRYTYSVSVTKDGVSMCAVSGQVMVNNR